MSAAPNNLIQYSIDYTADQDRYFKINTEKGVLLAELQGNTIFDRDRGYKSFDIQVKIQDNYQGNGRKFIFCNTIIYNENTI